MKVRTAVCIALLACVAATADESEEPMSGEPIMNQVIVRHQLPFESEILEGKILKTERRKEQLFRFRRYVRSFSDGKSKRLLIFDAPKRIKGDALLTWSYLNKRDDHWEFSCAGGQLKRAATSGKALLFGGGELTFEDLGGVDTGKYRFERVADQQLEGKTYFVVDAFPKEAKEEHGRRRRRPDPSKRRYWIVPRRFLIKRVDYYRDAADEEAAKRMEYSDFAEVSEGVWRAGTVEVTDLRKGTTTTLNVLSRTDEESAVSEAFFRPKFLLSGRYRRTPAGKVSAGETEVPAALPVEE